LLVLTFAAFAIGTSEFIVAGILPNLAVDFGVSIPTAGLLVTGYAIAVAVGGPILAILTAKLPRKPLIVFLLAAFSAGQVLCALAPSYAWLMAGRVFSACSHGLFFGAGSVAAIDLVPERRRGMAMALFLGGITVANLMGVPAGTAIGNALGWRWSFWAVGAGGVAAALLSAWWLPPGRSHAENGASLKDEFAALNHQQVYLSYLLIFFAILGSLAFATYQVPLMIAVTGLSQAETPLYLVIAGVGAVIGIYAGGRFADWKLMPSLLTILLGQSAAAAILLIAMWRPGAMAVALFVSSAVNWALNAPVQSRILSAARRAPHLASTLISTAYNIGIAAGAWVGALWIGLGPGYASLPVVAVVASLLAAGVAGLSWALEFRVRAVPVK
jgi:DHA1 family inner membrane transport protein